MGSKYLSAKSDHGPRGRAANNAEPPRTAPLILLVNDDQDQADALGAVLRSSGYSVQHAYSDTALELRTSGSFRPDMIVLELLLRDVEGLVFCAMLRARTNVPVLVYSRTRRVGDRDASLKLGADGFVPMSDTHLELLSEMEALLSIRTTTPPVAVGPSPASIRLGELTIDTAQYRVLVGDRRVHLTPTEHRILLSLASTPGSIVPYNQIRRQVWDVAQVARPSPPMTAHVQRLRSKLRDMSAEAPRILSVRGMGYLLMVPGLPVTYG